MSDGLTPEMREKWRRKGLTALPAIDAFVQSHGAYSLDEDQSGSYGNTNYVVFGHRQDQAVVIKYFFDPERREREVYGLRHWSQTGCVPDLVHDDGGHLLVQTRLEVDPDLRDAEVDPEAIGHSIGRAIATMYRVPIEKSEIADFESRFYGGVKIDDYVMGIVDAGRAVHETEPEYSGATFADSLSFIDASLPTLLSQPRRLYHQDAGNMLCAGGRLVGFFDLEMCRVGTLPIQIGCLTGKMRHLDCWQAFINGFESKSGEPLGKDVLLAAWAWNHFMTWRYLTTQVDRDRLPSEAKGCREQLEASGWPT